MVDNRRADGCRVCAAVFLVLFGSGCVVTRPPDGLTVGEAWLRALGDTVKIGVGVVTPLILVAGILEVVVTPRVVELILTL